MWLVEVSLQSVVALEPAILRSLPARCCFVRLLPDEKELCCEPRNDANGTTASAHSISKDNSRWQSRALLRQGHGCVFSARARLRRAVYHDDCHAGKRNMFVLVLHVSRMDENKLKIQAREQGSETFRPLADEIASGC